VEDIHHKPGEFISKLNKLDGKLFRRNSEIVSLFQKGFICLNESLPPFE
jgi:hypothetical protein